MPRWEVAGESTDGTAATLVVTVDPDGRTVLEVDPPRPMVLDALGNERLRAALGQVRGTAADPRQPS
jgi:hypothetical protein